MALIVLESISQAIVGKGERGDEFVQTERYGLGKGSVDDLWGDLLGDLGLKGSLFTFLLECGVIELEV